VGILDHLLRPNLEAEVAEREVRKAYHTLFNSPLGHKVLTHMMVRLHFFDEITSEEERVMSNYAKDLLNTIGVLQGFNVGLFVKAIMKAPMEDPDEDREA